MEENYENIIIQELQNQTLILEEIRDYKEIENNNFDLYFPIIAIPLFVCLIFKLFLRW